MTPARFASLVRFYTKTNSTTFSDTDMLVLANVVKDTIAQDIERLNDGYFSMEQYADLASGQRQYSLPDELLNRIQQVELKLDSTWTEYKVCSEERLNIARYATDEATISTTYSDSDPKFYLNRKSLYILTATIPPTLANGLKLWCSVYPTDLSDLTSTVDMAVDPTSTGIGFPRQFHELLARRVSIEWKLSRDRPIPLSMLEQNYQKDFEKALDEIAGANTDRSQEVRLPYNDGSQY